MKQLRKHGWTDNAASKVAKLFVWLQTKFAVVMNKQFSTMPHQKLKRVLVVFFLFSGGFSIYLIADSLFGSVKSSGSIHVDQMNIPAHFNKSGDLINETDSMVTKDLYMYIQGYKQYMDSLQQPIRPGLMDTIKVLEHIYQSQKFNK